jgi:AcrR family transcriptional regulator
MSVRLVPASRPIPHPAPLSRRERRSADIRERLFRAALHLFAVRGYLNTTVEDITEAADVGKGTFFNYFPTKEHVLATYGQERLAAIERALEKARNADGRVLPILKQLITGLCGQSSQSPELLRSIFAAHYSSAVVRGALQKRLQRGRRLFAEMFALAQKSGEIRDDLSPADLGRLTHIIFMGLALVWSLNPDTALQKTADEIWELLAPNLVNSNSGAKRKRARRATG